MLLTEELTKKIENEIKFGAKKIIFYCEADKDDFIQNCWLSILAYVKNHLEIENNITRLAIKGKIKNETIKYFNLKQNTSFDDEIAYKTNDLVDEIIERDEKNAKLLKKEVRFKTVEKEIPGVSDLNEKLLSPRFHELSKNLNHKLYRKLRNKKEYMMKRFVKNIRECSIHQDGDVEIEIQAELRQANV